MEDRPLSSHRFAEADTPENVQPAVRRELADSRVRRLGGDMSFGAYFRGLPLVSGGIYYIEYGTEAEIDTEMGDYYLVSIPLAGATEVSLDQKEFVETLEVGSLFQPGQRMRLRVGACTRHLLLRLERGFVQQALRKKIGRPLRTSITFDSRFDLRTPGIKVFRNILMTFVDALDSVQSRSMVSLNDFENLLVNQLLIAQPSNYFDQFHPAPWDPKGGSVARAAELIEARAYEPLTIADIACAVDTSVRALQDGFRRVYDTTPMAFLRDVRLQRVRESLMGADPGKTTVTSVAMHWGFQHAGRFACLYHSRFGEAPSHTLRRRIPQGSVSVRSMLQDAARVG